jgi:hypothetical protein
MGEVAHRDLEIFAVRHISRKVTMNTQSYSPYRLKATPMVVGLVLVGTGCLVGMSGVIVGGHAVMSAARRWFMDLAEHSSQPMKPKWGQTKVAMTTGTPAMQGNGARVRSGRA